MPFLTRGAAAALERRETRLNRNVLMLNASRAEFISANAELVTGLRKIMASADFVDEAERPIVPEEDHELIVRGSTILELRTLLAKHGGNGSAE